MRNAWIGIVSSVLIAAAIAAVAENGPPLAAPEGSAAPKVGSDENSVRQNIEHYARAFNAGDAKAVALLFLPNGEIIDEDSTIVQGSDAIERTFAAMFEQNPKRHIDVDVKSVRFVAPTVAIEDGNSKITDAAGQVVEQCAYTVLHVKADGKWLMASARDLVGNPVNGDEQLKQLEWLMGDWVDEGPDSLVRKTFRWSDDHRFILGEFTVKIDGDPEMSGTQRIGWDSLFQKIRNWVFDSERGFGEGTWKHEGNQWIAQMTGVTSEGKAATATTYRTMVSKDRMTWQCRDRVSGGEKQPDGEVVTIVRKPPEPR